MKMERLHEYLLRIIVIGGGILAAIYLGGISGRGQMSVIAIFTAGVFATAVFFTLRDRVWMFIPIFFGLAGKVSVLPLPFAIRHVAILFALATFLLLKAFKVIRRKTTIEPLDIWLLVNVLYVVTVFIRNPVGIESMGSERVGGRPYGEILMALAAYWVLSLAVATPRQAFWLPLLTALGNCIEFVLNAIVTRFPALTPLVSQFYSSISTDAYDSLDAKMGMVDQSTQREAHYGTLGANQILSLVAYFRPLSLLSPLNIFRFLLFFLGLYFAFISGFRSLVVSAAVYFCLSEYFRRGLMGVVKICILGVPALGLLLMMQGHVFDLPFSVQRSLSFLPASWNQNAKADAEGSTQWRVEMWKQMLGTDRYIQNKILGDGFGFTKQQLAQMYAVRDYGGVAEQQENFMIQGGVHSGPVSAIRYVGYVGLILYICLLGMIAKLAWRLINRARGTSYFPLALFFGLQAIWEPFNYIFIFGAYEGGLPRSIFIAGMLKMLSNSLDTVPKPDPTSEINPPVLRERKSSRPVPAFARRVL